MNYKIFNLNQTCSFAIIPKQNQPIQSISYPVGFFITLAFIGCILGCVFTFKKSQKQYQEWEKIMRGLQKSGNMQDENISINQNLSPQIRKQVETLEKIWNQSP